MAALHTRKKVSGHILANATNMLGVCFTVISLVRVVEATGHLSTVIDQVMSLNTVLFLVSAFLSYLSIRREHTRHAVRYERIADIFFLVGLLFMTLAGVTFAFWSL